MSLIKYTCLKLNNLIYKMARKTFYQQTTYRKKVEVNIAYLQSVVKFMGIFSKKQKKKTAKLS